MNKFFKFFLFLIINLFLSFFIIYSIFSIHQSFIFKILLQIFSIIFVFSILFSNSEYYYKILWISFIAFQPLLGILLYITVGQTYNKKNIYSDKVISDQIIEKTINDYNFSCQEIYDNKNEANSIINFTKVLKNLGKENLYLNDNQHLIKNGKEKFKLLFEAIENAQKYIHLEYYIISDSDILNKLILLLIKKSKEGVEIRILYDRIGSKNLSSQNIKLLQENKIRIASFGDFTTPFFNNKINFRNHRKITIIDNKIGFIGGINIGDEYLGYTEKYGYWNDLHLQVSGSALLELQTVFAKDWYFVTQENFLFNNKEKYFNFPKRIISNHSKKEFLQIINSGADNKDISIKNIYFKLICLAQESITIFTPYLVPDKDMVQALLTAAENKIKINIYMPGIPDKKLVNLVSHSYYEKLLEYNINIFEVNNSFLHSKSLIIDNELAAVGSANFDFRSFNVNFETTAFTNVSKTIKQLNEIENYYYQHSTKIDYLTWKNRFLLRKFLENFLQLFAPLF